MANYGVAENFECFAKKLLIALSQLLQLHLLQSKKTGLLLIIMRFPSIRMNYCIFKLLLFSINQISKSQFKEKKHTPNITIIAIDFFPK